MSLADTILAQDLAALAFCWRLERRDGVTIGLTSHDRDLVIGGVVYKAAPGLVPSSVTRGIGLEPESMDLKGALTSDAISETDLAAGKWDGAALVLAVTEWTAPGTLWLELMRGELGAVEQQGEAFSVELSGPAAALSKPVAPETSPGCRARLGDRAVLTAGGVLAVAGFGVLLLSSSVWPAMAGFLCIGLGASNLVPVLFRRAGAQTAMPPALAIAAISTTGYAGVLLGPALIGFVSQLASLPAAFALLAVWLTLLPLCAHRVCPELRLQNRPANRF